MKKTSMQIARIVENYLDEMILNSSDYDKELMNLGIDSMAFIHIVVEIEEYFGIEIPDEYLVMNEMSTVNKIVSVIMKLIVDISS